MARIDVLRANAEPDPVGGPVNPDGTEPRAEAGRRFQQFEVFGNPGVHGGRSSHPWLAMEMRCTPGMTRAGKGAKGNRRGNAVRARHEPSPVLQSSHRAGAEPVSALGLRRWHLWCLRIRAQANVRAATTASARYGPVRFRQ
jgi:hypothetical protein